MWKQDRATNMENYLYISLGIKRKAIFSLLKSGRYMIPNYIDGDFTIKLHTACMIFH